MSLSNGIETGRCPGDERPSLPGFDGAVHFGGCRSPSATHEQVSDRETSMVSFFPFRLAAILTTSLTMLGVVAVVSLGMLGLLAVLRPVRLARQAERLARLQRDFRRQREQLEAKFIERAAASGKPRGLRWVDVLFDDAVVYARDRKTRGLKALVAVEVSFEAIEGGGMEEVEAVSTIRAATAEFLHDGTRWRTMGRVYFNLAPKAAVKYLSAEMELVG